MEHGTKQLIHKSLRCFTLSFGGIAILILCFYCLPFYFFSKAWPSVCDGSFFLKYGFIVIAAYISYLVAELLHKRHYNQFFNLSLKMIQIDVDNTNPMFRDILFSIIVVVLTVVLIIIPLVIW